MKLRYTLRAVADIDAIGSYLRERSPAGASRVRRALCTTIDLIVAHPNCGRLQTTPTVRKFPLRRYPYVIYYTADPARDEIVILTIRHTARRRQYRDR